MQYKNLEEIRTMINLRQNKKFTILAITCIVTLGVAAYVSVTKYANLPQLKSGNDTNKPVYSMMVALLPRLEKSFCDSLADKSHKENFNDGYNVAGLTSPGTCELSLGENTSAIFSFENISKTNEPEFVLNIYSTDGRKIQTLPVAYSWKFDVNTINLHDDINFDGYKDALLRVSSPRAAQFTYYIYNSEKEVFEVDGALSYIFSPTFNPVTKTITTTPDIPNYYFNEAGGQEYYTPEEQTTVFEYKNGKYDEK